MDWLSFSSNDRRFMFFPIPQSRGEQAELVQVLPLTSKNIHDWIIEWKPLNGATNSGTIKLVTRGASVKVDIQDEAKRLIETLIFANNILKDSKGLQITYAKITENYTVRIYANEGQNNEERIDMNVAVTNEAPYSVDKLIRQKLRANNQLVYTISSNSFVDPNRDNLKYSAQQS